MRSARRSWSLWENGNLARRDRKAEWRLLRGRSWRLHKSLPKILLLRVRLWNGLLTRVSQRKAANSTISVLLLGSAERERAELSRHAEIRARCKNIDGRIVRNAPKDSACSAPLAKQK